MHFEEVFCLKYSLMRITAFYKTLFGYNQRTLPVDKNHTQKLILTFTFEYRLILSYEQYVPARALHLCLLGDYIMQEGV